MHLDDSIVKGGEEMVKMLKGSYLEKIGENEIFWKNDDHSEGEY